MGIYANMHQGDLFPSPHGDVLRPEDLPIVQQLREFPSPGGDVVCHLSDADSSAANQFPSPGGVVL